MQDEQLVIATRDLHTSGADSGAAVRGASQKSPVGRHDFHLGDFEGEIEVDRSEYGRVRRSYGLDYTRSLRRRPRRVSPRGTKFRGIDWYTRGMTLVDRIERAELVTREPDPDDRRAPRVVLTTVGKRKLTAAVKTYEAEASSILGDALNPEEQRQMSDYVSRLLSSIDEAGAT
jgi:hypothetical protein